MKTFFFQLLLLAFAMNISTAQADTEDGRQMQNQIWALEEAYVTSFRDADHARVIPMWHDRFLGWPPLEPLPADKAAIVRYLRKHTFKPATWTFEIEKAAIQIHANIAVTHFILHRMIHPDSGFQRRSSSRVTHTWIKENGEWKILAGMSAAK